MGISVGCQAPQRVTDDIQALKNDAKALYEFNQEFLKRTKTTNEQELQKKLRLMMISEVAHERATRGLELLHEYLGSAEFISNAQLTATEEVIEQIADRVAKKMGGE